MSDLAQLKIWDDPAIRDGLSWYLEVAENRRPAKFRISSTLATHIDPVASSEAALWAELDRLTPIFVRRWQAIRAGAAMPATADGPSLLELCLSGTGMDRRARACSAGKRYGAVSPRQFLRSGEREV